MATVETPEKQNNPGEQRTRRVTYPTSDGKPMAETREHREAMTYAIQALEVLLADTEDVWVSGNDFVYYQEGDPARRVAPDCYVVFGVPRRPRTAFKVWEEGGRTPNVVWEFTSRKTERQDREEKFDLYEQTLRVPEYFLFDPLNQYLRPRLQGYRLTDGVYRAIPIAEDGTLESRETGIRMYAEGALLRFVDPRTGEPVKTRAEAEEEIARLRAELERLRQGPTG